MTMNIKNKEIKEALGINNAEPAQEAIDGSVEPGGYGLVSFQEGVGYYDDDDEDGLAIVYFAFPMEIVMNLKHRYLKPATAEECAAYTAAVHSGISEA